MNLLLTGASGFLGQNLINKLKINYDVKTLGLTSDCDYSINLSKEFASFKEKYDVVVHAAGKAHSLPGTELEKQIFVDVNFTGTKNLCSSLEKTGIPKVFIFISTVAVYGVDSGELISENYPLNGTTPYAISKIQAEEFLIKWSEIHDVTLSILRPSLLAGQNPIGNLGNMIKGIKKGIYFSISNGSARKSVLMVDDIARLIPHLINKGGIYNVCDSHHPTFKELEILISLQLGKHKPVSIPYWIAKCMACVGDLFGCKAPINSQKLKKITKSLTFNNEKARRELNWEPLDVLSNLKI